MAYRGAIFDVDGVLVDSPHEQAWREALKGLMEREWRDIRHQTAGPVALHDRRVSAGDGRYATAGRRAGRA